MISLAGRIEKKSPLTHLHCAQNRHKYHDLITPDHHSWRMALQLIRRVLIGWQVVDPNIDTVNTTSAGVSVGHASARKVLQKVRLSLRFSLNPFFCPSGALSCIIIENLSRHSQNGDTAVIPLTQLQLTHDLNSRRRLRQPVWDEQHPRGRGERKKWKPFEAEV